MKALLDHANRQMTESQRLLGRAAADGRGFAANPMIHRFHRATDQYISTLAVLDSASRSNKAQVALINHAVKEALDANHIRQMARAANGSSALEQLLKHAADMKNEGTQSILRFAGNGTPVTNAAPSVETLALRGRDLLDAAEQVSLALSSPAAIPALTANPPIGPNPGRFQDDRAKIIGGTFGTGSQATGTTKTTDAPANRRAIPLRTMDHPSPRRLPSRPVPRADSSPVEPYGSFDRQGEVEAGPDPASLIRVDGRRRELPDMTLKFLRPTVDREDTPP